MAMLGMAPMAAGAMQQAMAVPDEFPTTNVIGGVVVVIGLALIGASLILPGGVGL
jgi:hypothetical protein